MNRTTRYLICGVLIALLVAAAVAGAYLAMFRPGGTGRGASRAFSIVAFSPTIAIAWLLSYVWPKKETLLDGQPARVKPHFEIEHVSVEQPADLPTAPGGAGPDHD